MFSRPIFRRRRICLWHEQNCISGFFKTYFPCFTLQPILSPAAGKGPLVPLADAARRGSLIPYSLGVPMGRLWFGYTVFWIDVACV